MFTFDAMPIKFVGLLIMFAYCTVWCSYELTRPQDGRQRVGNLFHLAMSVVMLLMVPMSWWQPFVKVVGMPALIGLFAVATAWFGWRLASSAAAPRAVRLHFAGHTAMFGAMTWHLSAMAAKRPHMGPGMPAWVAEASKPGAILWVFAVVGVPFMLYLLVAGINDLRRALQARLAPSACHCGDDCSCGPDCACDHHVPASAEVQERAAAQAGQVSGGVQVLTPVSASCHEVRPVGSAAYRLEAIGDACMNLGMFWMSTGLMVPLLPFFKLLSF